MTGTLAPDTDNMSIPTRAQVYQFVPRLAAQSRALPINCIPSVQDITNELRRSLAASVSLNSTLLARNRALERAIARLGRSIPPLKGFAADIALPVTGPCSPVVVHLLPDPAFAKKPVQPPRPPGIAGLTPRQVQVLAHVLAGHPSKNIANDLAISQRTVENHRAAIMRRSGATSLPALARMAVGRSQAGDSQ